MNNLFRNRLRLSLAAIAIASGVIWSSSAGITAVKPGETFESKVDINFLVNGRRPIWMGPVIRYTVYETTKVEARFVSLTGELIEIIDLGEQTPGQYTLPWDGSTEEGAIFEGKFRFELYFGDEYAANFWFISKSPQNFDDAT